MFTGFIPKPKFSEPTNTNSSNSSTSNNPVTNKPKPLNPSEYRPGNVMRLTNNPLTNNVNSSTTSGIGLPIRNSSVGDFANVIKSHSRTSSYECSSASAAFHYQSPQYFAHPKNQTNEIKQMKTDLGILLADSCSIDGTHIEKNSNQVNLIVGHHNWISVAYTHVVCCYKLKDCVGWQLVILE